MAQPDRLSEVPPARACASSGAIGRTALTRHGGAVLSCLLHAAAVLSLILFGIIQGNAGAPDPGITVEIVNIAPPAPPPPEPETPAPPALPTPPPASPARMPAQPRPVPKAAPRPSAPAGTTQPTMDTAAPLLTSAAPDPAATAQPAAIAIGKQTVREGDLQDYAAIVWQRVMRFRPPRVRLGGEARVRFTLAEDGILLIAEIAQSSGSGFLDGVALEAVNRAAPFPPPPAGSDANQRTFIIPFHFR